MGLVRTAQSSDCVTRLVVRARRRPHCSAALQMNVRGIFGVYPEPGRTGGVMRGSWAVGVAVVALSFVAGCSSGSSSALSGKPPEVLKTAGMAMARASSVKITATVTGILEDRTVQDRVRYVVFSNGDLAGTISDPGGTADVVYIVPRVAPALPTR